jgi:23S rRNA pseudouridine955/2504/2580 synthase
MKLIRKGAVRIGGRRADPAHRVAAGEVIEAKGLCAPVDERAAAPPPVRFPPLAAKLSGSILFEDKDLLVFDKPPGLCAHAGSGHARGALEALVEDYLRVPPGAPRPALVHRLDRDTSGILVLAKTQLALRRLNEAQRRGALKKGYLALVRGVPIPPEGEVRAALSKRRDAEGIERMAVVPEGPGALPSVTRYRVRRALLGKEASLLDLELETGRTHQIRAHLAWLGHPVALDRKYGDPRFDEKVARRTGLARLFLHAGSIRFSHPRTGEPLEIAAPLARDLCEALSALERIEEG